MRLDLLVKMHKFRKGPRTEHWSIPTLKMEDGLGKNLQELTFEFSNTEVTNIFIFSDK